MQRLAAGALALALFTNCAYGFDWRNPFRGVFGDREEARPAAPGRQPPPSAASLECPEILVESKTSSLRAPAGADSADVRYQLTLGLMARECSLQGDAIAIKVGVEGAAILGPAGQPGSYFGNLRIAARRQKDGVVLQSKTYRVGATVPTCKLKGAPDVCSFCEPEGSRSKRRGTRTASLQARIRATSDESSILSILLTQAIRPPTTL
ncbi:MAG: hypothetical protein HYS06_10405 [Methylocystis sp.]|nr:hypothetical protein [Methylocystis sp.]